MPIAITKTLNPTRNIHFGVFAGLPLLQLSYNHIQPMGWNDIRVPSKAPTNETRPSKTGMALAIMYAIRAMPKVQPSQAAQWVIVLEARCLDPRRARTKMYFAGNLEMSVPDQTYIEEFLCMVYVYMWVFLHE